MPSVTARPSAFVDQDRRREQQRHCARLNAARRGEAEVTMLESERSIINWKRFQKQKIRRANNVLKRQHEQRCNNKGRFYDPSPFERTAKDVLDGARRDTMRRRASNVALRDPEKIAALVKMKYT